MRTSAAQPVPVLLRSWSTDDVDAVLEIFRTTDDLGTQYPDPVTTRQEAARCLEAVLLDTATRRAFAVCPAGGGPVGTVVVSAIERRHDTGWVSYFTGSAGRGRGLLGRSVAAVAGWALDPAGLALERLELGHRTNNPASGAVAARAGFVREGTERGKLRYGDTRYDVATWARLRSDPVPPADGVTLRSAAPSAS